MSDSRWSGQEIAIIGMSFRLPGAATPDEFWANLRDGVESVSFSDAADLRRAGIDPALASNPRLVTAAGRLRDVAAFDAHFFGYSPNEAAQIDPQQRWFLMCAWEAVESAGYDLTRWPGFAGVFAGSRASTYAENLRDLQAEATDFSRLGNEKDFLATTVSYKLNLTGPAVNVQTACSTSLVALILGSQSLLSYQCDLALAGAVSILVPQETGYLHVENGVMSPDGHCRAFDHNARGSFPGNGVAVLVLKRLADALEDGDRIEAVIRGWGLTNDGARKVGYTAPSVTGQAESIAMALAHAQVPAESIGYVETHGTGTPLGDTVELTALTRAFQSETRKKNFCAIGSVKTNIGHTDTVAGAAGVIKTILALRRGMIPPSLHFEKPVEGMDLAGSPFFVNTRLREWSPGPEPRRAGVSSFGLGGTNAHVILEEAPAPQAAPSRLGVHLFPVSARSAEAADRALVALADRLAAEPELDPADVAYTLQTGRREFEHRRAVIASTPVEAAAAIRKGAGVLRGVAAPEPRKVVFLFPGTGDQYVNMTAGLYNAFPGFRADVDRACALAAPLAGRNPISVLYPAERQPGPAANHAAGLDIRDLVRRARNGGRSGAEMDSTLMSHTLVFIVEYALARLWMSLGVRPDALIGYSLGEFTAAAIAGVFSLEDALEAVITRAKLIEHQPEGGMLSAALSSADAAAYCSPDLGIAAVNAPELCVFSGRPEAIAELEQRLNAELIACRRLPSMHAFHSGTLRPAAEEFAGYLRTVPMRAPSIPYISNVTGAWVTNRQAIDPDHWALHTISTVRFSEGIQAVLKAPGATLIEVGPGQSLAGFALQQDPRPAGLVAIASSPYQYEAVDGASFLLENAARAWVSGTQLTWKAFYEGERRTRVALPAYPFDLKPYWIEPASRRLAPEPVARAGKIANLAEWLYVPGWRSSYAGSSRAVTDPLPDAWVIFATEQSVCSAVVGRLRDSGHRVITVHRGARFEGEGDRFTIDARDASHYARMAASLAGAARLRVVHFWTAGVPAADEDFTAFHGLILFLQSFAGSHQLDLDVISSGVQDVTGEETMEPSRAVLLSLCRTAPQEFPECRCRHIDIDSDVSNGRGAAGLLADLDSFVPGETIAWRGMRRWRRTYDALPAPEGPPPIRRGGTYLITGGFGRVALAIAQHLASEYQTNLVLVSRRGAPAEESGAETRQRLENIQNRGFGFEAAAADVADEQAMNHVFARASARWGRVDGVIHAAGSPHARAMRLIAELRPEHCAEHFEAKAAGVRVLERLVDRYRPDFCVLMSSLSTVLGGLQMTAYAAANEYMSSVAIARSRGSGTRWLSIDWDSWDIGRPPAERQRSSSLSELVMQPEEGIQVLLRSMAASEHARLAVSIGDLATRLGQWILFEDQALRPPSQAGRTAIRHPRPELATQYVAPGAEAEKTLAGIWMDVLGLDRVGVHDNFFQLGGHSLLGIRLIARVREEFGVEVPIRSLFENPTIAKLCEAVMLSLAEFALASGSYEELLSGNSVA